MMRPWESNRQDGLSGKCDRVSNVSDALPFFAAMPLAFVFLGACLPANIDNRFAIAFVTSTHPQPPTQQQLSTSPHPHPHPKPAP